MCVGVFTFRCHKPLAGLCADLKPPVGSLRLERRAKVASVVRSRWPLKAKEKAAEDVGELTG